MSVVMEKPRRADAGKTRLMGRDAEALSWIGDMRAITEPDLGVLLGRIAGKAPLSVGGATQVVRRWRALGLVEAQRILVKGPRVITLTNQGAELIGYDGRYTAPAWTQITHTVMCARVRLLIEQDRGDKLVEYLSERAWRKLHAKAIQAGAHALDGEYTLVSGHRVGVEVELTSKSVAGVVRVLENVAFDPSLTAVTYWCGTEAVERTVITAVEQLKGQARPLAMRPVYVQRIPEDLAATIVRLRENEN